MRTILNIDTAAHSSTKLGNGTKKVNGRYRTQTEYYFDDRHCSLPLWSDWGITSKSIGAKPMSTATNNRLYGKLMGELSYGKGELLTSSIEIRESIDMIVNRARQLGAAYLAVRKGNLKKAASILKLSHVPRNVRGLKGRKLSPTGVWLEYWMGWAPLCGDIGLAVSTIGGDRPKYYHDFSVGVTQIDSKRDFINNRVIPGRLESVSDIQYEWRTRFTAYGRAVVTNHNYRLADQLGFTNPALTAWQLVPFSFIVDWFGNIGQVLSSITDLLPFELTNTGQAFKTTATASSYQYQVNTFQGVPPRMQTQFAEGVLQKRTPGVLPRPRFQMQLPHGLSVTRGATAISLLTEIFLRK